MAEYLCRSLYGEAVIASSAGVDPVLSAATKDAITTLKEYGIDAGQHVPSPAEGTDWGSVDYVVALNAGVAHDLRTPKFGVPPEKLVEWQIRDPYGQPLEVYRKRAGEIKECLASFFDGLGVAAKDA